MKLMSLATIALLLACTASSGNSLPPVAVPVIHHRSENQTAISSGLVTIESSYKDLANPTKDVTVKGSGFLVQADAQTFVVTASHVSQGQNTVVHYQGHDLTIKGRFYGGEHDVEVLEVTGVQNEVPFVYAKNVIEWHGQEIGRARWVDGLSFALLNDWIQDPNLSIDNSLAKQEVSRLHCDLSCNLLQSATLMQPGSSGSPLIVKVPNSTEWNPTTLPFDAREWVPQNQPDKYYLRGLTIRRDRFFARSAFVPVGYISAALQAYQSGRRTAPNPVALWNVSGSLMFRITDSDLYESAAVSGSSGNGISMDGGNIGDLREENPRDVLSKVSAVPVSKGEPQFYWIMAMRHPKGYLMSAPLWFDMEHYLSLKRFTFRMSPDPQDQDKLLPFFISRFGQKGKPTQLMSDDGNSKISFPAGFVQIDAHTSDGATLSFLLNEKGFYCKNQTTCEDKFMAIVEVLASNGQIYFVDLRGFLFVNPAFAQTNAFHDPKLLTLNESDWQNFYFDRFLEELQKIRLSFRRKRSVQTPLTVSEGQVTEQVWTIP